LYYSIFEIVNLPLKQNAMKINYSLLVFLFLFVLQFSCRKNSNPILTDPNNGGPAAFFTTKIYASIAGKIIDQQRNPIAGAVVKIGSNTTVSDAQGMYAFQSISTSKNATCIKVEKDGFMPGYKTLGVSNQTTNYSETVLWTRPSAISFATDQKFTHTTVNDCKLTIPANSLVNKLTGVPYNGIAKAYIVPMIADENIYRTMPGGNIGQATNGEGVFLKTYGMMDVELYDDQNNALQIQAGKSADLSIALHQSVMSNAPSTVPTWFVDDKTGIWTQEGFAVLENNHYNFSVKHFTPWNCDSSLYILFADTSILLSIVDDFSNQPLHTYQCEFINASNMSFYGYTVSTYTGPYIPVNTLFISKLPLGLFTLKIYDRCNHLIYTTSYSHNAGNPIGKINIPIANSPYASISATFSGCGGSVINEGRYFINGISNYSFFYDNDWNKLDASNNSFIKYFEKCNVGNTYTLTVYDYTNLKKDSVIGVYDSVNMNLGSIQVCGYPINFFGFKNYYPNGSIETDSIFESDFSKFNISFNSSNIASVKVNRYYPWEHNDFNFNFDIDGNAAFGLRQMYLFTYFGTDRKGEDWGYTFRADTSNLAVQVLQNDYATGGTLHFTYNGVPSNIFYSAFGPPSPLPDSVSGEYYLGH
jgi:hypothetical protein